MRLNARLTDELAWKLEALERATGQSTSDVVRAALERYFSEVCQSLPMDLVDATLVLPAEWLGHGRILSVDRRDFGAFRWKNRHPFENLLV